MENKVKEHHLDEAMNIRGIINHLTACIQKVEAGTWTIYNQSNADGENTLTLAAQILSGQEDRIRTVARQALLVDLQNEIAKNRKRLTDLGVEVDNGAVVIPATKTDSWGNKDK